MSVVVTNTVKQLQVNVRPHRYNICSDKTVLRTSKALCREVASKREREAGEREREREITGVKSVFYHLSFMPRATDSA